MAHSQRGDRTPTRQAVHHITELCVACLPTTGTDGGGVGVLSSGGVPSTLCATDAVSTKIEDLQFTLGEGPCVDAARSGAPVLVADLADGAEGVAARWPAFLGEARDAGARAIFAFPLRIGVISLGTLDLYRSTPGPLGSEQLKAALSTSDLLGQRLLDLETGDLDGEPTAYRVAVHQAAGMLTVQLGVDIGDALARLRGTAYAEGVSINELAADVVAGRRRFGKDRE